MATAVRTFSIRWHALYEAATSMLVHATRPSALRSWAVAVAKRRCLQRGDRRLDLPPDHLAATADGAERDGRQRWTEAPMETAPPTASILATIEAGSGGGAGSGRVAAARPPRAPGRAREGAPWPSTSTSSSIRSAPRG